MGVMRRIRHHPVFAVTLLVAACQPATDPGPGVELDTEGTLSAYGAMDSLFTSPALAGFQALDGRTPFGAAPVAVEAVGALIDAGHADAGRTFALALASRLSDASPPRGGPATAPIISALHRGVTFVYDAETDEYAPDPAREGAPATGVRFVLYDVDLAGRPVVENEIGYADLIDEGDGSAEDVVLHLTAVSLGTTVLEYRIALDVSPTGGTLAVHGAIRDQAGLRLDFDIDATSTLLADRVTLDVAFDLRVDARDFSVTGTVSGVEEGVEGEGTIELVVRHRDDSIRLSVHGANGEIGGSVFVNGSLFATVTGDSADPVITSASGVPLTFGELLVLRHIIDSVEDVFDFLEDLLDPVDELVILAIIL